MKILHLIPPSVLLSTILMLFSACFLLAKPKRGLHDFIGLFWICFVSLAITRRGLQANFGSDALLPFIRITGYFLAYGPFLYLYTRSLMVEKPRLTWKDGLHFLPFLISLILALTTNLRFELAAIGDATLALGPTVYYLYLITGAVSMLTYNVGTIYMLRFHKGRLREFFGNVSEANSLAWVNGICWLFMVGFCVQVTLHGLALSDPWRLYTSELVNATFLAYLLMLSFFIMRQPTIFSAAGPTLEDVGKRPGSPKYAKSGLEAEKARQLLETLLQYMEERKPYLSEDLDINELARAIGTTTNSVSQVLNTLLQKNFYSFVNDYRVKEVATRLQQDEFRNYPIMRVALQCGFNSKSSFNAIFRKYTGLTPSEYRAKVPVREDTPT